MATPMFRNKLLAKSWRDWKSFLRTATPVRDTAVLDRRHIYILPTRQGLLFVVVLICMLIGSINYGLSLGFGLTFLLAGLGAIAMLHTWRNLAHLTISSGKTAPVFAGAEANFSLIIADLNSRSRYAISLSHGKSEAVLADIQADGYAEIMMPVRSHHRGWLSPGKLTLFTDFPLGLFHAWSYVNLNHRCLIYPAPAPAGQPPVSGSDGKSGKASTETGDDDFSGLRAYQHGDSLRRIDWKASAREQGLLSKQFHDTSGTTLWLDWALASAHDTESRISQMTRWVLVAHAGGQSYGLRLPGKEIAPATGEAQYRKCLKALALFGSPP
jgi:uncharacterized protein (DUF58 family)